MRVSDGFNPDQDTDVLSKNSCIDIYTCKRNEPRLKAPGHHVF